MEEYQEEKALKKYAWYALFAVTACSFVLFSVASKLLGGIHSSFFLKTGAIAAFVAIILKILNRRVRKVGPEKEVESIFQ